MSVDVDDDKFKKVSRNSPNKSRGVLKITRKGEINYDHSHWSPIFL